MSGYIDIINNALKAMRVSTDPAITEHRMHPDDFEALRRMLAAPYLPAYPAPPGDPYLCGLRIVVDENAPRVGEITLTNALPQPPKPPPAA